MVRAPGGQLITRIKTEAAAGKLAADVVNHSDRGLMLALDDLFQDYTPPNAADYLPDALVSPKLWPRVTLGWSIAYNTELVKNPPKTWMDLTKPEYDDKQIGQVVGAVRRHDLDPHHVRAPGARRGLLEEAGGDPADRSIPSGAPTSDCAGARRGRRSRRCSTTSSTPRSSKERRADRDLLPARGRADHSLRRRQSPRPPQSPNAAKLFLNWCLSQGRPGLPDQGARQPHLAEEAARLSPGLRPQGDQDLGAEVRGVREAARALARGVEQDLRLSAVIAAP